MVDFCNLIVIDLSRQKPAAGHKDITSITAEEQDPDFSPGEIRSMWTPRDQQVSESGGPFILLCSGRLLSVFVQLSGFWWSSGVQLEDLINPDDAFVAAAKCLL